MFRLFVLLMLLPFTVMAHDIDVTWSHATTRTDGTAITGTRSYSLRAYRGTELVASANPTGTAHTFTGLAEGVYTLKIATIEGGRQGADAPPITVDIPFPPSSPTGLKHVVRIVIDVSVTR